MSQPPEQRHHEELTRILATGASAYVVLDPRHPGVNVPPHLKQNDRITLEYGNNLAVPIPDLNVSEWGIAATLSFSRTMVATFVPWAAVRGVTPSPNRVPESVPELRCVLCRRGRSEVHKLVEGEAGCVCSDCAVQALAVLAGAEAVERNDFWVRSLVDSTLAELDRHTLQAQTTPLLWAALAFAGPDAEALSAVAIRARDLGQPGFVVEAVGRIPREARKFRDHNNLFIALRNLERVAEAKAVIDALDFDALAEPDRAVCSINRAVSRLDCGGEALGGVEADLAVAAQLLDRLVRQPEYEEASRRLLHGIELLRLEHDLARGRVADAAARARTIDPGDNAHWLMVVGDALRASNDASGARASYECALEHAHPEGRTARQLRERLGLPTS